MVIISKLLIFAPEILNSTIMAKKKAKEEIAKTSQPEVVTSNRVEKKGGGVELSINKIPGYEHVVIHESNIPLDNTNKESKEPEPNEEKPKKLRVLASDRLNSLIQEANELGITDVVQVLNSDKYGQFYLIYRA